jgi:hypothetical protein
VGTYVYAVFGHCGDPARVLEIVRPLVEQEGFHLCPDLHGLPDLSLAALEVRWSRPSTKLVDGSLRLESDDCVLSLYPRGGAIYHSHVRWWAFASNGFMDSGLGRDSVRSRSRSLAGRFGSDRILYLPDSTCINRLPGGGGIEEEEAYLLEIGPPFDWDHGVQDAEIYMRSWFRELL